MTDDIATIRENLHPTDSEGHAALDRVEDRLATAEQRAADETDAEHQSERRAYWRQRAEQAERERDALTEVLLDLAEQLEANSGDEFIDALARDARAALGETDQ